MGVYIYDWSLPLKAMPLLLRGLLLTFEITVVATVIAVAAGLMLGLARVYGGAVLATTVGTYVAFFRSLSPYIYMLWIYFGIASAFGIDLSPFAAGVASLALLYSAYFAEIFRGALQAVERGQVEAGLSLGVGVSTLFISIILPQATRTALPPLMTSIIILLKDSSLVAAIGAPDLMYVTNSQVETVNHPFEFYTVAALLYFAIVLCLSLIARLIERRIGRAFAR